MSLEAGGIIILDYGSQTAQLIARRVRELGVFAALLPFTATQDDAARAVPDFRGVILSGGPSSVYDPGAPRLPDWVLDAGRPVLGICYGMQLLTQALGGKVAGAAQREYGQAAIEITEPGPLFAGLDASQTVWMSHGDRIEGLPDGFRRLASSANAPYAAIGQPERARYGLQFHPEVIHTPQGRAILRNFVCEICGAAATWTPEQFIDASIARIRAQVGKADLPAAIALNTVSFNLARTVGPGLGGLLISLWSVSLAFAFNAASYIVMIVVLWRWKPGVTAP